MGQRLAPERKGLRRMIYRDLGTNSLWYALETRRELMADLIRSF